MFEQNYNGHALLLVLGQGSEFSAGEPSPRRCIESSLSTAASSSPTVRAVVVVTAMHHM